MSCLILADLSLAQLRQRLRNRGVWLRTGRFTTRIQSPVHLIAEGLHTMYADFSLGEEDYADFHIRLRSPHGLRSWLRPQVNFSLDGGEPFNPLPLNQAYAMLEWCLNWCVTSNVNTYLILHAAVLERDGRALVLPAPPGSGKSTLCAGLMLSGWRLLSDELTLIDLAKGTIMPLPRPVSLKNASIDVIAAFAPGASFTRRTHDTVKGTICHLRPTAPSITRSDDPAYPAWLVFPHWEADAPATLTPRPKARAFMEAVSNAFNFSLLGAQGFTALGGLIERCDCYDFRYGRLEEAVALFNALELPRS
ncbi:MAG: HprK-related kinase A [Gammaproteobacteria bacterium]